MTSLSRKLRRNLLEMKGPVVAIVLIIGCGIASFVTMVTAYRGLTQSRDVYYARYRMADVFASMRRAPRHVLDQIEGIDGVRKADGRIVFDVTLDLPEIPEPVSGRVVSVPDRRRPILCDLHLTSGDWFTGDGDRQVIVAERFARAHDLKVGDRLRVLMNNRKQALRVVATALSPEFVYQVRGAEILPDHERFTILWMSESFAEAVFGYEEAMNDVVVALDRGVGSDGVIAAMDRMLDRHGSIGAYPLKDQASNLVLSQEIEGLRATVTIVPTIFLCVAAFVLHVLMGRLVRAQRTQISLFRAFGYTRRELAMHYLELSLVVGGLGALLGVGGGLVLAHGVIVMYQDFFVFPVLAFSPEPAVMIVGGLTSLLFATLGAARALRTVSRLDPADGLRPEAPSTYGRSLFERVRPLWRHLGLVPRMVLRHVTRAPVRALVTSGGVALGAALVVVCFYIFDAWDAMLDIQYRLVERQDVRVQFHEKRGRAALREIGRLDGVLQAEPELAVAVELVNGRRSKRTALQGIERGSGLYQPLDRDLRHVALPEHGLLLSERLARILGVGPGSSLEVRVLEGPRPTLHVVVERVVDECLGAFAYADQATLSRWLGESSVISGARLRTDPTQALALGAALKALPAVSSVSFRERTLETFRDTVEASQWIMNVVLVIFAGVIAFGVLYNTARISLEERGRELGSLRVIGFTHREAAHVLSGEELFLTAMGLAPGLGLGVLMCYGLTVANQSELYRFPFVIQGWHLLGSAAVVLVFAVLANLFVSRRLRRLDLIEVLKTRE